MNNVATSLIPLFLYFSDPSVAMIEILSWLKLQLKPVLRYVKYAVVFIITYWYMVRLNQSAIFCSLQFKLSNFGPVILMGKVFSGSFIIALPYCVVFCFDFFQVLPSFPLKDRCENAIILNSDIVIVLTTSWRNHDSS